MNGIANMTFGDERMIDVKNRQVCPEGITVERIKWFQGQLHEYEISVVNHAGEQIFYQNRLDANRSMALFKTKVKEYNGEV